ncbi:DEAD/DEAH box helicase [Mucilaginibacter roseus]|uniref:DEAD/DEAH box helicase n=1 Tax=Mucilaginibacter roseus TaxID=1528868 RepID=A0ABS8U6V7_9SPHI|nr:DEAD/DEAH box helicase [Mucilaginibacter roseus]MCD8741840.1 DEAD/DEAH box helicase [Mucilaginibacter roseus]
MSFQQLNLIDPILKALQTEGYTTPTPIQAQSIPIILQKKDLLGCAQTGTGKTAAFSIPTLQLLYQQRQQHREQKTIKALILTPTRELAIQIGDSLAAYGKHTGLKHLVIFGGVSQNPQTDALKKGVDILVATPGRLLDLMNQRFVHLDHIQMLILDEADRMLDMGFVHDVKKIIAKVPAKRQTLFFSATMPKEIQQLADSILNKPERVEVTPVSSTAETIQQEMYFVAKGDKKSLLNFVLQDKSIVTALVFTRTKHGADKVVKDLNKAGITAEAIHGNKSQNARQRALNNFKAHTTRVLVATDIAARGIDIDELAFVINYELPNIPETYVHRIGRTGRAGASGKAISFCDEEEKEYLKDIEKLIGVKVPVNDSHPHPLAQLTSQERILQDLKKQPHHNKPSSAEKQRNNRRRNNNTRGGNNKAKGGSSGMSGARPSGKRA